MTMRSYVGDQQTVEDVRNIGSHLGPLEVLEVHGRGTFSRRLYGSHAT